MKRKFSQQKEIHNSQPEADILEVPGPSFLGTTIPSGPTRNSDLIFYSDLQTTSVMLSVKKRPRTVYGRRIFS